MADPIFTPGSELPSEIPNGYLEANAKPGAFGSGLSQEEIDAYHQEEGEAAVQAASALLTQAGVPFDVHIEAGAAAETITRVADETGAHEIFMGTRGLGSVSALFMGSVATGVLSLTELPVTLVK